MTKNLKRALPLMGAIALVSSALMTGSGAALAGKATPTATPVPGPGSCDMRRVGETTYRVHWDLSDNNGRWFWAEAILVAGAEKYPTSLTNDARFEKTSDMQVEGTVPGDPQSVTMLFQFYDRKGMPLGDPLPKTVTPPACG